MNDRENWLPFKTLHGMVRLVLLVDWDPIGVFGYPGAMDEYDRYAASVCALLEDGTDKHRLTEHLRLLETQNIAIQRTTGSREAVAAKLLRVRSHFFCVAE